MVLLRKIKKWCDNSNYYYYCYYYCNNYSGTYNNGYDNTHVMIVIVMIKAI